MRGVHIDYISSCEVDPVNKFLQYSLPLSIKDFSFNFNSSGILPWSDYLDSLWSVGRAVNNPLSISYFNLYEMSLSCKDFENILKAVGKCKQLGFIRWEIWTDTEWKLEGQIK